MGEDKSWVENTWLLFCLFLQNVSAHMHTVYVWEAGVGVTG